MVAQRSTGRWEGQHAGREGVAPPKRTHVRRRTAGEPTISVCCPVRECGWSSATLEREEASDLAAAHFRMVHSEWYGEETLRGPVARAADEGRPARSGDVDRAPRPQFPENTSVLSNEELAEEEE